MYAFASHPVCGHFLQEPEQTEIDVEAGLYRVQSKAEGKMEWNIIHTNQSLLPHPRIETKIKELEKWYIFNDPDDLYFRLKTNLFIPLLGFFFNVLNSIS